MSILGFNNSTFVQGLDTQNASFSKLKKLSSRLLSTSSTYLQPKYSTHLDSEILDMCQDYVYAYSTEKKSFEMGSKFSHPLYGVPNKHYEVKKPAINIIGGYVGAKSQMNRENHNHHIIQEIVMQLLPDILPATSQTCEDLTVNLFEMQGRVCCKMVHDPNNSKKVTDLCQETFSRPVCVEDQDSDPLEKDGFYLAIAMPTEDNTETKHASVDSMLKDRECISHSPTYATVESASPLTQNEQTTVTDNSRLYTKNSPSKNAKNRRKRRRRKRRQFQTEKNSAQFSQFPGVCEETNASEPSLSGNEMSHILNSGSDACTSTQSGSRSAIAEVDSKHSKDFLNIPTIQTNAKGSSFLCHNNSIAFIMNGNDELSDTDSDWSCDTMESFEENVWESFKENFECFQNVFMMEGFCTERSITARDNDCELQDDEFFLYINQVDLDGGSELAAAEIMAARLKDANKRWNYEMEDVVVEEKQTKVKFAPESSLVEVRYIYRSPEEIIRCESWDYYQLDRCRFKKRIESLEPIISPCFDHVHRQKMWDILQCATQNSTSAVK